MFTISGVLGDDLVNVISFLISEDNLGSDKDTIILGNVKQYLNKCFNDDGNILEELGFSTQMESFKKLKNLIADKILEKADKIDNTGRIIYALFFSFLIIFSVAIIIFMLLLSFLYTNDLFSTIVTNFLK